MNAQEFLKNKVLFTSLKAFDSLSRAQNKQGLDNGVSNREGLKTTSKALAPLSTLTVSDSIKASSRLFIGNLMKSYIQLIEQGSKSTTEDRSVSSSNGYSTTNLDVGLSRSGNHSSIIPSSCHCFVVDFSKTTTEYKKFFTKLNITNHDKFVHIVTADELNASIEMTKENTNKSQTKGISVEGENNGKEQYNTDTVENLLQTMVLNKVTEIVTSSLSSPIFVYINMSDFFLLPQFFPIHQVHSFLIKLQTTLSCLSSSRYSNLIICGYHQDLTSLHPVCSCGTLGAQQDRQLNQLIQWLRYGSNVCIDLSELQSSIENVQLSITTSSSLFTETMNAMFNETGQMSLNYV